MYTFNPEESKASISEIGFKAFALKQLPKNYNVPKWFAVPASVLPGLIHSSDIDGQIRDKLRQLTKENISRTASELKTLICSMAMPEDFRKELTTRLIEVTDTNIYVSVRSSSGDADDVDHSFAGIHENFLFVNGTVELVWNHILKVWASAYCEKSLLYRSKHDLPLHPPSMGVVVQQMVDVTVSGIIRTADIENQDNSKVIVSAVYGSGAGLGRTGIKEDKYVYDKLSRDITTVIGAKARKVCLDATTRSGVYEFPVEEGLRTVAALSPVQVGKLVAEGLKLEMFYGRPQEIDFCYDESGELHFLQRCGIIGLREYGPSAGNYQFWDNSMIVDSYAGVTSPMTFSFVRDSFAAGSCAFRKIAGVCDRLIEDNQLLFRGIPGFFDGRIYLNVFNLLQISKQIPGHCCRDIIKSLAGKGVEYFFDEKDLLKKKRLSDLPCAFLLSLRTAMRFMTLSRRIRVFKKRVDRFIAEWDLLDFNGLQPHELINIYRELEKNILRRWETPVINVLYVRYYSYLLGLYCRKWCNDEDEMLKNRLMSGVSGPVPGSTGALMKLALKIKKNDTVKYIFQTCSPDELALIVPSYSECEGVYQDIQNYLSAYGLRSDDELKLEAPSLCEFPEYLYQSLKKYTNMNDARLDVNAMVYREKVIREEAEKEVCQKLRGSRRRKLFSALKHARKGVSYADEIRSSRVLITAFVRRLMNAVGEKMASERIIDLDQDIYFLTMDEVREYINGRAVTVNLRPLISVRRDEYDRYNKGAVEIADCFCTYGMAYNHNTFVNKRMPSGCELEEIRIKTTGFSAGGNPGRNGSPDNMADVSRSEKDNDNIVKSSQGGSVLTID